ncbi:heme peroxidase [Pisolithus marmoratus]|nr:heme peroxidase [Pisolithus marmoratus]
MSSLTRSFSSRFSTKGQTNGAASSPTAEVAYHPSVDSGVNKAVAAVKDLMKRATEDINESTISALLDAVNHAGAIDDRKQLLEHILTFMANHPSGKVQDMLQSFVIKTLYYDLAHPPSTFIGEYAFRTADGANNNPDQPDMGQAGTPYARSVQQANPLPRNQMPDAGLVFDTLLRRDEFRKHPAGLSSLMFAFAALVIHSVFRTDHKRPEINMTSGYVDLAPLYGNDQVTQDKIRIKDGRGLLHTDAFAEDRLLLLPPAVCVLLVLFNRNHNYIARRLLEINERGTWCDPSVESPHSSKMMKQDEEIFQIARLCNCAWFAAVVFSDYFSAILGLNRQGTSWSLEPFGEMRDEDHQLFERGRGNACSVEFNCLYRWHATTSAEDEVWIRRQFEKLFPGMNPEQVTLADFYKAAAQVEASEPCMEEWTFGNLSRQKDGSFKDSDLAKVLMDATSHHAASFGARGTPPCMRVNEIMGIESNRFWGVCSLNDFRKFLGLKTYSSFREWNPDPKVADAAEKLYGHIDNLELYVGLQAEETKPVTPGAGLCPGYTIARAILSDAIALTRGDRFFNQDFTPYNYTAWGFADCQRDPNGHGFGSTLGRLFLRTLPGQYNETSIYTWFPLIHPEAMEKFLKDLGKLDQYTLERPKPSSDCVTVSNYVEVGEVLRDETCFAPDYASRAKEVIKGKGFFAASGEGEIHTQFLGVLTPSAEAVQKIGDYFYSKTRELIDKNSVTLIGTNTRSVNIVGDVLKYVPVYWTATEIGGIPLKTSHNPHGVYTPKELYDILGEIYQFIFLEIEPAKYMVMKQRVKEHVDQLSHCIKASFGGAGSRLSFAGIFGTLFGTKKKNGHSQLLKSLFELGHATDEVVNEILALMVGTTVELSLALTNVVNLLLVSEDHATFRAQAKSADAKDFSALEAYVIEALRIDPPFGGVYRIAKKNQSVGSLRVSEGERLFLNIAGANLNEEAFPNPTRFDATRTPRERYLRGDIAFRVLGADTAPKLIIQVLRAILSFDNVRRGPGQSGKLARFRDTSLPQLRYAYLNEKQLRTPWPTSLTILYDVPA